LIAGNAAPNLFGNTNDPSHLSVQLPRYRNRAIFFFFFLLLIWWRCITAGTSVALFVWGLFWLFASA